jgi:predicted ABC-type transport system involved in lysophospholipase L1 biosynthesis ATPase subunit
MTNEAVVQLNSVSKSYRLGRILVQAVSGVSLEVAKGELVALAGPSGSGKTTLLNLIGCIDKPDAGRIVVDGADVTATPLHRLARTRAEVLGFVFQTFNLVPVLTAWENVEYPLLLRGMPKRERDARVTRWLESVLRECRRERVFAELGERLRDVDVMRVYARGDDGPVPARDPVRHQDRFPHRRRTVVHGGVRNLAAEQARDLRLELEHHLQRALGDLGLVRRVAGQELAALNDVIDARRDVMPVRAAAEEEGHVARDHVLAGERRHVPLYRQFGRVHRQAVDRALEPRLLWHVAEKLVDRTCADHAQHLAAVGVAQG